MTTRSRLSGYPIWRLQGVIGVTPVVVGVLMLSVLMMGALMVRAASAVASTPAPAWQIRSLMTPTNISSPSGGRLTVFAGDVGGQPTDGSTVTVTDTLPVGVTPTEAEGSEPTFTGNRMTCSIAEQTVTCTYEHALPALNETQLVVDIHVAVVPGVSGTMNNLAAVSGGGAADATAVEPITVSAQEPPFGLADFSTYDAGADGVRDTQAGDHPNALVTTFDVNSVISSNPEAFGVPIGVQDLKDVVVDLPLGLVGNPQATPKCPQYDLTGLNGFRCPVDTFIGTVSLNLPTQEFLSSDPQISEPSPIVNVQPEAGYPAQFAFVEGSNAIMLYAKVVRTSAGYVERVISPGITRFIRDKGAKLTFFGDPRAQSPFGEQPGTPAALFTNPVDCTQSGFTTAIHVDSWQNPAPVPLNPDGSSNFYAANFNDPQWVNATSVSPPVIGCEKLQFNPSLSVQPDTTQADSPMGLNVDLKIPQNEDPNGLATPPLKAATVTLPEGVSVSPGAADGLQACSDAQFAVESTEPASCPAASQVATVSAVSPVLDEPVQGQLFVGSPECAPCSEADAREGRLLRLLLQVQIPGADVKFPGTVSVNPTTGQLTASFDGLIQQPVSDIQLHFKGGPRAPLATPQTCGQATTTSELTPWSAPFTRDAQSSSSFDVDWDGAGGACPGSLPFSPSFSAGTITPMAGGYSPLTLTFSRHDREQDLSGIAVSTPPGLLGKLASVPLCGEPQAAQGTCSAASEIGGTEVAAGAGSHPFWEGGSVFLTGPYAGAPFGLSLVTQVQAGPFNLGDVVVRAAIHVNPDTSALTVDSDPLPQIIDGVPLRIQTVNVTIDRPGFIFNPTNCDQQQITAAISATQGASATAASPFAVAGCANLPFTPKFTALTQAKTSKSDGASLHVKVLSGQGQANIGKVRVLLPKQLPSRLATLHEACVDTVFNADPAACPAASVVGTATALTPVLKSPLTGPAYFVSHGGIAFPDLVIVLQGEGIVLYLDGNTDIRQGITSSTFNSVPDAPISTFDLVLPQGPHSALSANGSLCSKKLLMPTTLTGQNGAVVKQTTQIAVSGCPKHKQASKKHRNRRKSK